jgi:hypothetical protein
MGLVRDALFAAFPAAGLAEAAKRSKGKRQEQPEDDRGGGAQDSGSDDAADGGFGGAVKRYGKRFGQRLASKRDY